MQDDRIEENEDKPTNGFKIVGAAVFSMVVMVFLMSALAPTNGNPDAAPEPVVTQPAPPVEVAEPVVTKQEYIKSTKLIGDKSDPIYLKAFRKNPDKYAGELVRIKVKVLSIHEKDGKTLMNVYLSRDMEVGVVTYDGSIEVYDGDIITVYGEVAGTVQGENGMGATMTWPGIVAKYIKKEEADQES